VLCVSTGRGPATWRRAQAADLTDAGTLSVLVGRSDAVLSVCPPHAALPVARMVAASGFAGEMDRIAVCFAEAGLPDGFARAATELYRRLAPGKELPDDPPLDEVLRLVRAARDSNPQPPDP
jgi:hypothetical protein